MSSDVESPVSLWWASLDVSTAALEQLKVHLSKEERQRANRLVRPHDRERFIAARGRLRILLADVLSCTPREVPIVTGNGRKPRLEGSDLRFDAARSDGIALYGVSWESDLGVDVEAIRPTTDIVDVAARFFSPAERAELSSLPPSQRLVASYQCWACKEAYAKAIGTRSSIPISTLDVYAGGGQEVTVSGWTVHQVKVAGDFVAAVAGAALGAQSPSAKQLL